MSPSAQAGERLAAGPNPAFMWRVFYAFAALALLSVAISLSGRWLGRTIAMAGHTDDPTMIEVVIGNNVLVAPANAIRFQHARRDGVAGRLDLYLHWPEMSGYSAGKRDAFNQAGGNRSILFLSFEERAMSRDMSGRLQPIYRSLIQQPGAVGPAGLTIHRFRESSGYLNETLAVGDRAGALPYVARCLEGAAAAQSLAPCERDVHLGENLSLTYRFPLELLPDWQALDAAVLAKAGAFLRTGG
jgi:hypothetical protein